MQVTKFAQSCLVLDNGQSRILIDPGNLAVDAHDLEDFGPLDAVLYTHRHADHFDERPLEELLARRVPLYANDDVCDVIGKDRATAVRDGQSFDVGGFQITARDLPHVPMVDGSAGPPNTGFVVDGTFFHPGDGVEAGDLRVDHVAVPIAGPSISFRDAYRFVDEVGARIAVAIHYDLFIADPEQFANSCDLAEVIVLADGESAKL